MTDDIIRDAATRVLAACRVHGLKVATAESCTGGLVAGALTEVPGSSDVLDRGFVTYSNAAKEAMLGVPTSILERHGAVSRETADAMATGALAMSNVDLVVAITGIAGPGGGTPEKPVGLVWIAIHGSDAKARRFHLVGDRAEIRQRAAQAALEMVRRTLAKG